MLRLTIAVAVSFPLLVAATCSSAPAGAEGQLPSLGPEAGAEEAGAAVAVAAAAPELAPDPVPPSEPDPGLPLDPERLRPWFAGRPELEKAWTRYEEGKVEEALRLFTAADDGSPEVALYRGLASLQLGRAAEAAALLEPLPERFPAVADRIRWYLGSAREQAGDLDGAVAAWALVPEGSLRKEDARIAEARVREKLGQRERALELLAPLLDRPAPKWGNDRGATALHLAGEIHRKLGNREAARQAWLRLWSEHPLAPEAQQGDELLRRVGAQPTLAQRVARARAILDAHRNAEATKILEPLLPRLQLPDPLACGARFDLGRAYRKMRQHTRAIPILEAVAKRCDDPGLRVRALYVLGQSATIVAPEKAVGVYETIVADHPDHSFADDALYFLSELHERAGDVERAKAALVRLIEAHPEGDYRADALFRLYWLERRAGNHAQALPWLETLAAEAADAPVSTPLERALYWQGRSLAELDRREEAIAVWERLVREHPAGYYAMLARGRLAELDEERSFAVEADLPEPSIRPVERALRTGPLEGDPAFAAALELIRLGFPRAAAEELLRIDRDAARQRAGGSPEPVLLVAWLLDRVESRQAAHQIARTELRRFLRGRPEGEAAIHFRIAYPLAYRDLIERHAGAFGVPPDLMQALMREESSLDPKIVSWAGAVGLTQLMPSTAAAVARRLKLSAPTAAQLTDPDLNVKLGAAYLGELLRRWKGNPALAAASYNAGPTAVARWLASRGDREMDEFVEEIPIEETRNYVKRVLDSFATYRLLYADGSDRFLALKPVRADGTAVR